MWDDGNFNLSTDTEEINEKRFLLLLTSPSSAEKNLKNEGSFQGFNV